MEPVKFEDTVREQLEQRTLQPSKNAWSKLESQLDQKEEKKTNWYAIAAGFIGVVIIASVYVNQKATPSATKNELVEQEVSNTPDAKNAEKVLPVMKETTEVAVEEDASEEIIPSEAIQQITALTPASTKEAVAQQRVKKENKISPIEAVAVSEAEEKVTNKVNEVVAKLQQLQNNNTAVSAAEVDALLAKAQRELRADRLLHPATHKVDATALLNEVEWKADRSFKDKVFLALGEEFQKIRTAVVERNN